MKFCTHCGNTVVLQVPPGDDRERFVCISCEVVHYNNPRVIVGCLPVYEDKVLLCLRAIEPRKNFWTLPAGFMENGETSVQGAARETWEEARARVDNIDLYRIFDVPYINQIYMFYRCDLVDGEHSAGPESIETRLFTEQEIPWEQIAFPVVARTLQDYFPDALGGHFPVKVSAIDRRPHRN